ncbi:hypothetical protein VQ056_31220 [Paenibacillus sp. JTLBN-2024]
MPTLGKRRRSCKTLLMLLAQAYSPDAWHVIHRGHGTNDEGFRQAAANRRRDDGRRGRPDLSGCVLSLVKTISERRELFADAGVKTAAAYRRARNAVLPQFIKVVNRRIFYSPELLSGGNELLEFILREGGNLGITFVLTSNRISGHIQESMQQYRQPQ